MPKRKHYPKPKLVVNNIVDFAKAREERDMPVIHVELDPQDTRSEVKHILEMADEMFHENPSIYGGYITLVSEDGELISFSGGITLGNEALLRKCVADEKMEEFFEYGDYGEDV